MTSLARLVRNSVVLLAGTFLSKGIVFVSYLVLTRRLGAEDFGRYTTLFVYLSFFAILVDAGIESILIREIGRRPADASTRLGDALLLRGLLVVIAIPLSLVIYPVLVQQGVPIWLLFVASLTLVISNRAASLRSLFEIPYRSALKMEVPTILGVLSEALFLVLLLATVGRWGLSAAVVSQTLAPLPFALGLVLIATRVTPIRFRAGLAGPSGLMRAAMPLLGAMLLNVILTRLDVLLLQRLRGPIEVGHYAAPVRLVEVAALLPILLMTSVFPMFAASHPSDPGRIERLLRGSVRFLVAVVVPVAIVEAVYAGPIVGRLFGAEFAPSASVLPVLALGEILVIVDIVLSSRLVATNLEARNLQIVFAATVANIAANVLLIPRLGALGAAWATLFAYLVRFAAAFVFADTRPPARQSLAALLPAFGAGAGAVAVLAPFRPAPAVAIPVGLALYVVLLVLFRGFSRREWELLRDVPRQFGRAPQEPPEIRQ